jgi:hypothetical protein
MTPPMFVTGEGRYTTTGSLTPFERFMLTWVTTTMNTLWSDYLDVGRRQQAMKVFDLLNERHTGRTPVWGQDGLTPLFITMAARLDVRWDRWTDLHDTILPQAWGAFNAAARAIAVRPANQFPSASMFIRTVLHEFAHATGRPLGRYTVGKQEKIPNSQEELVAELSNTLLLNYLMPADPQVQIHYILWYVYQLREGYQDLLSYRKHARDNQFIDQLLREDWISAVERAIAASRYLTRELQLERNYFAHLGRSTS